MTEHDEAHRLITEALSATNSIAAVAERSATARATLHRAVAQAGTGDRQASSDTLATYATTAAHTETDALYDLCFAGACMTAELAPHGHALNAEDPHGQTDALDRVGINLVNLAIAEAWPTATDQLDIVHREGGDDALRGLVVALMGIYRRLHPL